MTKILFLCVFMVSLNAHSLKGFIDTNEQNLIIKAYYYGNSPCIECEVSVFDDNNEILYSSKTDKNGIFSFKNPNKNLQIKINGGLGHEKVLEFKANLDQNLSNLTTKNPNLTKFADLLQKDDLISNLIKFSISIFVLFAFFGSIYALKRKNERKSDEK